MASQSLKAFLLAAGLNPGVFDALVVCCKTRRLQTVGDLICVVAKDGIVHADAPLLIHALRPIDRMKVCQHLSAFIANTHPVAAKTRTSKVLRLDSSAGFPRTTPSHAYTSTSDVSTPSSSTYQHHQAEWGNTMRTLALTSQRKPRGQAASSSRQFHPTPETSSSALLPRATSTRHVLPACSSVLNVRMLRWPNSFTPGVFCYLAGDVSKPTDSERRGSDGANAAAAGSSASHPGGHSSDDSQQQKPVAGVVPLLVRIIDTVAPHQPIDQQAAGGGICDHQHLLHYHVEFFAQTGGRRSEHYCRTARRAIVAGAELLPLREQLNFDADLSTWSNVEGRAPLLLLPTTDVVVRAGGSGSATKQTRSSSPPPAAGRAPPVDVVGWKEEFETMSGHIVAANSDLDISVFMTARIVSPHTTARKQTVVSSEADSDSSRTDTKIIDCGLLALLKAFDGDNRRVHEALQRALASLLHRPVQFYFAAESGLSQGSKNAVGRGNVELCFVVQFAAHTYGIKPSAKAEGGASSPTIETIADSLCCELVELCTASEAGDVLAAELGGGVDVLDMQVSPPRLCRVAPAAHVLDNYRDESGDVFEPFRSSTHNYFTHTPSIPLAAASALASMEAHGWDACRGWEPGDFVQFTNPGFAAIAASTENPPDFLARILGEVEGHQHGPAGPLLKLQLYEEIVYGCGRYRAADKVHLQLFSHLSKVAMAYSASERAWHHC